MRKLFAVVMAALFCLMPKYLGAHCEIPCGIYDDEARINMIGEHIATIEKATKSIIELSQAAERNDNQTVRWIMNKEKHADLLQEIVSQYFLTQRIKPVEKSDTKEYDRYVKEVTLLHNMLIYAMKAKQTVDLENVKKLNSTLEEFRAVYFEKK